MDAEKEKQICADRALIEALGGPTAVARRLKMPGNLVTNARKVQQWTVRGIPAKWKLKHPNILGGRK